MGRRVVGRGTFVLDSLSSSTLREHFLEGNRSRGVFPIRENSRRNSGNARHRSRERSKVPGGSSIHLNSPYFITIFLRRRLTSKLFLGSRVTKLKSRRYGSESSSVRSGLRISRCGSLNQSFLSSFHVSRCPGEINQKLSLATRSARQYSVNDVGGHHVR